MADFFIKAEINPSDLNKLNQLATKSTAIVDKIIRRTVTKVCKRLQSQAGREIAKANNVPMKILKRRLRYYLKDEGATGKVWFGLDDLPIHLLGTPRQTRTGVKVGRHFVPHAFVIDKYGGKAYVREGADRFPLSLARVSIDSDAAKILEEKAADAQIDLAKILNHEIDYEFSKLK